ncbi:uncharacterized protein LOC117332602 [Pecten maximus]|uniref:uncharacterized protein LOC117332602 n=1 Tax=Pecten maximus TaxID=6579 RepID=UPI001458BCB4|nr:uncharacterized protein LOC117332602 [Pecten maximus]
MAKVNPATKSMQVDDEDSQNESEKEDGAENRENLKKKRPNLFNKYYSNRSVETELDHLSEKVKQLKTEKKIYKEGIKWILTKVGNHTIADSVVTGNGNVIIDGKDGKQEDLKKIMTKHFTKVTEEHATISEELARFKNIVDMSLKSLERMGKRSDKKLGSILELLELTMSSDEHFTDSKIEQALLAIENWTAESKRKLSDMYKAKIDQAPKEALSTIQFIASKSVDPDSRRTLQKLFDIDLHALEDDPSDQDMCFRGLLFWRQKDIENNNAEHLKKLLVNLDKATLEQRKQDSESILKLKVSDLSGMDGTGEDNTKGMNRDIKEILDHVKSISHKLATTERRDILEIMQQDDSAEAPRQTQQFADVHRRVRSLSVGKSSPPKRSRTRQESCSDCDMVIYSRDAERKK